MKARTMTPTNRHEDATVPKKKKVNGRKRSRRTTQLGGGKKRKEKKIKGGGTTVGKKREVVDSGVQGSHRKTNPPRTTRHKPADERQRSTHTGR